MFKTTALLEDPNGQQVTVFTLLVTNDRTTRPDECDSLELVEGTLFLQMNFALVTAGPQGWLKESQYPRLQVAKCLLLAGLRMPVSALLF